ncbi:MAG: hypothetical protein MJ200_00150 [Mycoplasmoidaceae bacterium]|nr:hypothetical protein [Mycoplasmoidaceae bacterium]
MHKRFSFNAFLTAGMYSNNHLILVAEKYELTNNPVLSWITLAILDCFNV